VAYQIRDDIADFNSGQDVAGLRPSLVLALARQNAQGADRQLLDPLWRGEIRAQESQIAELCQRLGAVRQSEELLADYKALAVRSLGALDRLALKSLLRRVVGRIFDEVEFNAWCAERQLERLPASPPVSPP